MEKVFVLIGGFLFDFISDLIFFILHVTGSGSFPKPLSAKEEKWYDLNIPKLPVGITTILFEYSIKFDNSLCRKGITLGHDQFIIETESKNIDSVNKLIEISNNEEKFCIEEKVNTIKITSLNFNFVYNKKYSNI